MSRRDTIIIAVLVNTGLLAILFLLASGPDDGLLTSPIEMDEALVRLEENAASNEEIQVVGVDGGDEVDQVLQTVVAIAEPEEELELLPEPEVRYVTITIKRGDALEKIARANRTTVAKIKDANNLRGDRLSIGQVLRIPLPPETEAELISDAPPIEEEAEYYTIQGGDNPWKIAKKFNVRFNTLLELNHLDEENARKLRAGDKLRVR